ncbi:MAG: NAD-glutamate dehydrogenase [Rhodospirillales bacterium]|nr:NAD-glutamate dehydrogenase [Rhodospirillales bacterium]
MAAKTEQTTTRLIGKISASARRRLGKAKAALAERYVRQYYENVPPHDIIERDSNELAAIAVNQLAASQTRRPGQAIVRVFNPTKKSHGWESERTIVEAVTDDMPFLVDSITAELNRLDLTIHLVVHPIMVVTRTAKGALRDVTGVSSGDSDVARESFMHIEVTQEGGARLKEIKQGLDKVLKDVRASVEDWRTMRHRMWSIIEELEAGGVPGYSSESISECRDFLRWIHDNHFTFLGYRDYTFKKSGRTAVATIDKKTGLGILRDPTAMVFENTPTKGNKESTPPEVDAFMRHPDFLMVTKTNQRSTVHRRVHMDAIAIKRHDARGNVIGQRVFVGLFTSTAYNRTPREIPLLRQKLDRVIQRAGFRPASHDGKALMNILETYPRDELFQISDNELLETAMGILHLQERQRVALFMRKDDFERHMSCLVYVPRDRFNSDLRFNIGDILASAFSGRLVAFRTQFGDGPLARVHFIIKTTPGAIPSYDAKALEEQLVMASRAWSDKLEDALCQHFSERAASDQMARYGQAFGPGYQEQYDADTAVSDMTMTDNVLKTGTIGMSLYDITDSQDALVRFKLYHPDKPIPLSDALPVFEHMGFRVIEEAPHKVEPQNDSRHIVMIHDFGLVTQDGMPINVDDIRENFHDAFQQVWYGSVESDGFNALVCRGGLTWRQVVVIRAYCKYLRQAGIPFSQIYMEQTLSKNPGLARMIVDLFQAMFDPCRQKTAPYDIARIKKAFEAGLENVTSADEDRILRRFLNVVDSTFRTNYYQLDQDGDNKSYLSFKLNSRALEELPLPRPMLEIFVYSPRVEGVHLRFGMVARGGLRWSDRPEDFRTEVLGLVKAQQVKNAVIVPVGSKGGFVVKRPPAEGGRDAFMAEGIDCYQTFISGLLDLTDNIVGNGIRPPKQIVRRDQDDPYLVVAADKGTATFSDIANGVSEKYGHWLGDAFASGGSQGYDHKGMGITAKGAWESVKRHFREMGADIQSEDFTVIGVGDMSGDVFGNGMLLSKHIKLLGAFNHLHIFVDPNPDPAKSWAERNRLFNMGRSSWTDYDKKIMSKGAMIYERSAKSITLTPEIKKMFGMVKDKIAPNELLRAMLHAQADLLWFGGIGTYIKAESESHADAGDRANDAIRINGEDVAARVIGEGANLGVTQLGRVDYALRGGRLNTDFIDNSAGVDCSDHEVNIKILIDASVKAGKLSGKERNKLLVLMTNEVSELVLVDNYQQSQAISVVQAKGYHATENQMRLMRDLERRDLLNRDVEFLPDDETIGERVAKKIGLTRPELSVVLSYAKLSLYEEILASDVPDDPATMDDLIRYFPTPLQVKFRAGIEKHRLRREIIATRITNSLINRVGDTFVYEIKEKTGMPVSDIVRAFVIAREVYGVRAIWGEIERLDNKVAASVQLSMLLAVNNLLERATMWFLRNGEPGLAIGEHVAAFKDGISQLAEKIDAVIPPHYMDDLRQRARPLMDAKVPHVLALRVVGLVNIAAGCDIVRLANRQRLPVIQAAKTYFAIGARFRLGRLRAAAEDLGGESYWQQLAVDALIEEIFSHQLNMTAQVLGKAKPKMTPHQAVEAWIASNAKTVDRAENVLNELGATEMNDLSMIAVASRQLRSLCSE